MDFIRQKNDKDSTGWRLLVILLVIAVTLVTVWFREGDSGPLHAIRSGADVVAGPVQTAGSWLGLPFVAIGNAFTNINASTEEYTSLQEQNAELVTTVSQLEEYKQENERLTALLDLENEYGYSGVAARIIGRDVDSYHQTITVDKGTSDGLTVGMPVMDVNGLLGQIESISSSTATVNLLTDENSGVAAMLQSTRVEGILTGSTEGSLYLNYIPVSETVNVGDIVITSGEGGVFPKGIIIGEVLSVDSQPSDLYYTIVVKQVAQDKNFEEVLILDGSTTSTSTSATAGASDSTSATSYTGDTATNSTTGTTTGTVNGTTANTTTNSTTGGGTGE